MQQSLNTGLSPNRSQKAVSFLNSLASLNKISTGEGGVKSYSGGPCTHSALADPNVTNQQFLSSSLNHRQDIELWTGWQNWNSTSS
jgi:hypothetical protein